jgi:hypothetical protein
MGLERDFARQAMKIKIKETNCVESLREMSLYLLEKVYNMEDQIHQKMLDQIREIRSTNEERMAQAEALHKKLQG